MVIVTSDGISHGPPEHLGRGSAFRLDTACGLEFYTWLYARKIYRHFSRDRGEERPVLLANGVVDCMTCLVKKAQTP